MERDMNQRPEGITELRLKQCDISVCEAMCCYDGVYLGDGEEARITQVVQENPDFFSFLPDEFIVDYCRGRSSGRKTAIGPHDYQDPHFPAHFTRTMCVFNLPDARCSLQVLATQRGEHPWTYKPMSCYLHPLLHRGSQVVPPPIDQSDDPQKIDGEDYPGYPTYTLCGRHREDGLPWREVLSEELACFQRGQVSDGPASEEDR
jgi:hypothetical protein